jgi:large subunit ribosomal protein L23
MAIFNKKQNIKKAAVKTQEPSAEVIHGPSVSSKKHAALILKAPRITEKGTMSAQNGIYVFNVAKNAGKREISEAIRDLFKVTPRKVRVVSIPGKVRISKMTNQKGKSASGKKAYVYLKKGDTLEIA